MNGARLIAIHRSRYFQTVRGLALGPGPFVSALEFASGVQAQCLGKPEPEFFHAVLKDMGVAASETVMIGDVRKDLQCTYVIELLVVAWPIGGVFLAK